MKKTIAVILSLVLLSVAGTSFAGEVFATKNGKKYHQAECPLIKNKGPEGLSLKDAEEKGLTPCAKCFKDESSSIDAKETKKLSKKSKKSTVKEN